MNKIYFDKVRAIINEFDPCSLICLGAPPDEYDDLTNRVINFHLDKKSKDEIRTMIIDRLENYFGCIEVNSLDLENKAKFLNDLEITINRLYKELEQMHWA